MRDKKSLRLLVFSLIALLPGAAYGLEKDPYMRRSLTGRVYLEYENAETRQGAYVDKFNKFQQTYNLDTKGNIYARNALIYSLSGSFVNTDSTQNSVNTGSQTTDYNFETTALPQSAIPLTLFGNHSENKSTTTYGNNTSDVYGLDWFARIRTLPVTKVHAEKRDRVTEQHETVDNIYKVSMKKDIGPTKNELQYDTTVTDDASSGRRNSQNTINFTNDTVISRSTEVHAGATQNITVAESGQKTTLQGVSIDLSSAPSSDFSQKHRYTFYGNATNTGNQQGHNYDGSMNYAFSKVTLATASATFQKNTNNTTSSQSESENGSLSGSFVTAVTRTIGFSQSVSYSENKTNIVAGTNQGNMTGRKTTSSNTRLTYKRPFKLALVSSYYGVSYTKDQTTDVNFGGGTSLGQNAGLSLSNINFNKYVGFDAASSYSKSDRTSGGDVHENSYSYSGDVFNKAWKKYADAKASYSHALMRSWLSTLDKETETIDYHLGSGYVKNTKMAFTMHEENAYSLATGDTSTSSKDFTLNHKRSLLGGSFGADLSYDISDSTYRGGNTGQTSTSVALNYSRAIFRGNFSAEGSYSVRDYTFNTGGYITKDRKLLAMYSKLLFRRVSWRARVERAETERNDANVFSKKTSAENTLAYQLRAWRLYAEHRYSVTSNESFVDMTETRILFRVERAFGMFL